MRSRIHINAPDVLARLQELGSDHIVEVLTESAGEADASNPEEPVSAPVTEAQAPVGAPVQRSARPQLTSMDHELERASRLVSRAREAIAKAIESGRTGQIRNLGDVRNIAEEMVASTTRNPGALQSLMQLKAADDYTYTHCVAVGAFMISLGRTLGLDELALKHAGTAGLLHDVGKAGVDEKILNKPGKLTADEFGHVKLHPLVGETLLRESGYTEESALDVVRHHHERLDGRGYPDGLNDSQISLLARMGAVTDVYDAVTSERAYHKAVAPTATLQMMMKSSREGQFDGQVVNALVRTLGLYPNGSLVRLQSDKLAVVREQSLTSLTTPVVRVIFSLKSNLPLVPFDIRLEQSHDRIVSFAEPAKFNIPDQFIREALGLRA